MWACSSLSIVPPHASTFQKYLLKSTHYTKYQPYVFYDIPMDIGNQKVLISKLQIDTLCVASSGTDK